MADRRRYAVVDGSRVLVVQYDGFDGHVVRWTGPCSGCHEGHESGCVYDWSERNKCEKGGGCPECGYTGLSRQSAFVPLDGVAQAYYDHVMKSMREQELTCT